MYTLQRKAPDLHIVIGASGQLGRAVVSALVARGLSVRAVARSPVQGLPPGVELATGDVSDASQAMRLCRGASVVYGCLGAPHVEWARSFSRMTCGLLAGAAAAAAKLIYADNLYAYGPQTGTLVEGLPATTYGAKPRLRAELAAMLLHAHATGRARVVVARASDFYGPGVTTAMLGAPLLRQVAAGRRVFLPGDLDAPHTFTFIPDFAQALTLLALADDADGQVWHAPSAPALPLRDILGRVARLAGARLKLARIPGAGLRVAAWLSPAIRELVELGFQWDRPYLVSHAKYAARFAHRPTPIDDGLRATLAWALGGTT
jgi:nucleoside-diphosphate-sugar epimerase